MDVDNKRLSLKFTVAVMTVFIAATCLYVVRDMSSQSEAIGDKALAEQLRPGGDDDVPQFLFFHGYPSNRFKIAKFSLLAAYSFRNTRKFRS